MTGSGSKLKIALLLNDYSVPAWQFRIIELIELGNFAEISLLILDGSKVKEGKSARLWKHKGKLVWKLHGYLDAKLFPVDRNPFTPKSIKELFNSKPTITLVPRKTGFCDYITEEDFKKIKEYNIDVALRFGFRIIKGDFLNIAKYGIWSYHHADNRYNRGTPPGYWEVVNKVPLTGVILQILGNDLDGGKVLYKSLSSTNKLSIYKNIVQIYWKAVSFVPRKLEELYNDGWEKFDKKYGNTLVEVYDRPLYSVPGNFVALKNLISHFFFVFKSNFIRFLFKNQWVILFKTQKSLKITPRLYNVIEPPKSSFWADPFGIKWQGRNYIFFEEYPYKTKVGFLSVIEVDNKGKQLSYKQILRKPYHLSYPFIFSYLDDLYMIPENDQNKKIDIYKCVEFPEKWEHTSSLMENISAVDTTLTFYNGKWWMFTTIQQEPGGSKNEELFLFYSNSPLSNNWTPHPMNPIVSDIRGGRMGGQIINYNNKLIRVGQDGSREYGYGLLLFEITKLNETTYSEVCIDQIEPKWNNKYSRTHTLNFNGDFIVMDALRYKFRWF